MRTHGGIRAARIVYLAVRNGELPRIDRTMQCADCGSSAKEYEHRDYNRPLSVEPICRSCNVKRGRAVPWTGKISKKGHGTIYFDRNKKRWRGEIQFLGIRHRTRVQNSKEKAQLALEEIHRKLNIL